MKQLIVFCFLLPFTCFANQQDSVPLKTKIYNVKVDGMHGENRDGYLQTFGDQSISITRAIVNYGEPGQGESIPYQDISSITFKKKGNATKGIIYGAVGGFLVGVIIGLASGDDPVVPPEQDFLGIGNAFRSSAGEKAIGGGLMLAGAGAVVGGVTGALIKKRFIINGKKEKFDATRMQTIENIYATSKN